ncbi:MAG TPA: DUF441 domain-containing protein [Peptococcaceae bacterium]|jgi:uncharacterized membrane protein (DUF441 family)|nr:DUF441 domain-containing protein [Clostridia bacterium]HOB81932.1 DUF441 domain-containing protein [Peptococcaceae bacterium]HPZ71246.1 DUF441 domain-containing protein [Peptococcaceae bacterium]HQD53249.1 DUF441 domain-containing protein [Peptococcaceae bacterium]
MWGETLLLALIIVGIIAKAPLIASSACILMVIKMSNLTHYFPFIERRGLELGLVLLMLSVLTPIVKEKILWSELKESFLSLPGFLAFLGGVLATYLNSDGLRMLKTQPELLLCLMIGSVVGIVFFGGIPVGPLMAAGLAAFFLKLINFLQ